MISLKIGWFRCIVLRYKLFKVIALTNKIFLFLIILRADVAYYFCFAEKKIGYVCTQANSLLVHETVLKLCWHYIFTYSNQWYSEFDKKVFRKTKHNLQNEAIEQLVTLRDQLL